MPDVPLRSWTEPYGSDLQLLVEAPSPRVAFAEAALALGRLLAEGDLRVSEEYSIQLEGPDREALLVGLLEEVLYLFETESLLPARVALEHLDAHRLEARFVLGRFEPGQHRPGRAVKAITWHRLAVDVDENGTRLSVILDL